MLETAVWTSMVLVLDLISQNMLDVVHALSSVACGRTSKLSENWDLFSFLQTR